MNRCRIEIRYRALALLAALALPFAASALSSDREQPVDLSADFLEGILAEDGATTVRGNVAISQGSMKISADEAVVERKQGAVVHATLSGNPAAVEQTLDSGGQMRSVARQIDYDIGAQVLILTGAVVVTQPEGELRGERIRYDISSGRLEGGGNGGRVQLRIEAKPATKPAA